MRPISPKNKTIINNDPYYKTCCRRDEGNCSGRITIEHVLIFAGRQIDEIWNLLPVCEYHHSIGKHMEDGDLNKEKHTWIALNRATDEELLKYSKAINYIEKRTNLNNKYGTPKQGII